MSRLVPQFETIAALVKATNDVRAHVVRVLAEYVELSARMREFEDTFSSQVLHAAQQLHEAIGQRKRLEAELERIRTRIDRGGYDSTDEIEDDIRTVLNAAQADDDADLSAHAGSPDEAEEPADATDDGLDEATRKRIIRDFKRIVLPAVHADTSDTSFSDFDMTYSAYQARDYVLMEALVVQFRGPVGASDGGRTVTQEQAAARLREYRAAARRLDGRLGTVRRTITQDERDHPEQTRERMRQRNEQIRQAIDDEAERMLVLRRRLETLLDSAHNEDGASP